MTPAICPTIQQVCALSERAGSWKLGEVLKEATKSL